MVIIFTNLSLIIFYPEPEASHGLHQQDKPLCNHVTSQSSCEFANSFLSVPNPAYVVSQDLRPLEGYSWYWGNISM